MKSPGKVLKRMLALARKATPPQTEPMAEIDVRLFARRTASVWVRQRPVGDAAGSAEVWEYAGRWALAGATAIVLLVAVFRPGAPNPNPFDLLAPIESEESELF